MKITRVYKTIPIKVAIATPNGIYIETRMVSKYICTIVEVV